MPLPPLRSWFQALVPPLEPSDPAERLSARLVSAVVDLMFLGIIGFTLAVLVGPVPAPRLYRLTLPAGLVLIYLLRRLLSRGWVRSAAVVLCAGGWLINATDLQLHGPNTIAVGGFLLMVVVGGVTLGPVAAVLLAVASVGVLATVMLRSSPALAFATPTPWMRWLHYSTQLILASVLVAWWARGMRRLLRQLRESEARHTRMLEESPDATVSVDKNGMITFWNTAAEQMLGYPRSVFLGRRWDSVPTLPKKADHVERARDNLGLAMEGAGGPVHELELVHRDGRTVTVEVKSVPLHQAGEVVGVVSTVRDVSARKQAERERAALEEQLARAQRMEAVGRFAGGIAHDFNNILTIVFNAAEFIRMKAPDAAPGAVNEVLAAAERGASLARQLLAFSRRNPSETHPTDVHATIVALTPMLARLLGAQIALETRLCEGVPTVALGQGQLDQVLVNLAVNARDAMPGGGTIRLTTASNEPAGTVEIAFADTGCGMSPETAARAFEPFFTTKGERGTGLGLSIVSRIVDQAQGTVRCESEPGRGTTVRMSLPVTGMAPLPAVPTPVEPQPRRRRRVVLVDDDPLVRAAVARALSGAGVDVDSVETPLSIADVEARLRHASALITDVVMPGMTGPDLVEELRRRGCRTRVIFVSGYAEHALLERVRNTADASFLAKPFTAEQILTRLG